MQELWVSVERLGRLGYFATCKGNGLSMRNPGNDNISICVAWVLNRNYKLESMQQVGCIVPKVEQSNRFPA